MAELHHIALDVPAGDPLDSQSGLQNARPRIYGVLAGPKSGKIGAVIMHPASSFMGHYFLEAFAKRGISLLALNSRYVNNDSTLIMERVIQDLGAGVKFMRQHFGTVFLQGNSGGASLVAFYQAQAEKLTLRDLPSGDALTIHPEDLPPADGVGINAGHAGRATIMLNALDASVIDERDALARDPELDIFGIGRKPPFDPAFIASVRAAQRARSDRITRYARQRLSYLRGIEGGPKDEAFVVYRTNADPRSIDVSIDPNGRMAGGIRALPPREVNQAPHHLGRFTTLKSWLSQWSLDTRADGPTNLARTSVPVLHLEHSADAAVFPTYVNAWREAAGRREEFHSLAGANHYLRGQPELVEQSADLICDWAARLSRGEIRGAA